MTDLSNTYILSDETCVDFLLHTTTIHEQHPKISAWLQSPEGVIYTFLVGNHSLRLRIADPDTDHFALGLWITTIRGEVQGLKTTSKPHHLHNLQGHPVWCLVWVIFPNQTPFFSLRSCPQTPWTESFAKNFQWFKILYCSSHLFHFKSLKQLRGPNHNLRENGTSWAEVSSTREI